MSNTHVNKKVEVIRMKGNKQAGDRIRALRGNLTQAEFAKSFGVTQSMISAWEAGRDSPSAEIWIMLGELAGYPDCYWFYEQAGLDRQKLLAATEKTLKDQIRDADSPLLEGQIILVPRVRKTSHGLEPTGLPLPMPAEAIPNPLSTYCFVLESGQAVVDTADANAPNFLPFYNQTILAEFLEEKNPGAFPAWPKGLRIGVLYLGEQIRQVGMVQEQTKFFWIGERLCHSFPVGLYQEKFKASEPSQELANQPIATIEDFQRKWISNHEVKFPRLPNETDKQYVARMEPIAREEDAAFWASPERLAEVIDGLSWPLRRLKLIAAESYFAPEFKVIGRVITQLPLPATKVNS